MIDIKIDFRIYLTPEIQENTTIKYKWKKEKTVINVFSADFINLFNTIYGQK